MASSSPSNGAFVSATRRSAASTGRRQMILFERLFHSGATIGDLLSPPQIKRLSLNVARVGGGGGGHSKRLCSHRAPPQRDRPLIGPTLVAGDATTPPDWNHLSRRLVLSSPAQSGDPSPCGRCIAGAVVRWPRPRGRRRHDRRESRSLANLFRETGAESPRHRGQECQQEWGGEPTACVRVH